MKKTKTSGYYVSMTDKFLSGWGRATNKTDKYIICCETFEQAEIIEKNARKRSEMKHINICFKKPYYNKQSYHSTYKNFNELGSCWTNNN